MYSAERNKGSHDKPAEPAHDRGGRDSHGGAAMLIAGGAILLLIFACDALMDAAKLRLPGSLLALVLLIAWFRKHGRPDPATERLFDTTIPVLPLFFVPDAVGIIEQFGTNQRAWPVIAAAIVIGTVAVLAIAGRIAQFLLNRRAERALANETRVK
jgi:holin-like protein